MPNNMPLAPELLRKIDAYWRAANYLSVGQIYLLDNPLLRQPLTLDHIKPRQMGHWGTTPGLNFIYAHLNRIIKQYDLSVINVTGPGRLPVVVGPFVFDYPKRERHLIDVAPFCCDLQIGDGLLPARKASR